MTPLHRCFKPGENAAKFWNYFFYLSMHAIGFLYQFLERLRSGKIKSNLFSKPRAARRQARFERGQAHHLAGEF